MEASFPLSRNGVWHQVLGRSLVSWSLKKQNSIALSTAEAEYIAAGSCYPQLLWMQQTLKNYGYTMNQVPLLYDNESVINIAYNPCEHSRTKHIDIRHHFLRDHAIKEDIVISHLWTNEQLVDIFTKPLDEKRFREFRSELNIIDSRNVDWKVAHLKCFLFCQVLSLYSLKISCYAIQFSFNWLIGSS
jgi:hypothetical protein